jgi:branched-subunit amino acid transport protein
MIAADPAAAWVALASAVGIDVEGATTDELAAAVRRLVEGRVPPLALIRAKLPEIVDAVLGVPAAAALRAIQQEHLVNAELELARKMRADDLLAGRLAQA